MTSEIANSQRTFLDLKFSPILKAGRRNFNTFIEPKNFDRGLEQNIKNNKVQYQFPENSKFFCSVNGKFLWPK